MGKIAGLQHLWLKAAKGVAFPIIRAIGALRPKLGTRVACEFYRRIGMNVSGEPNFVSTAAWFDGTANYSLITLGEGCTISRDVRILTHDWAPYTALRALGYRGGRVGRVSEVVVGRYAFVGLGVTILPGAVLGEGCIVGAGSVVRGNVPDYGIVVGNPGELVGDARELVARRYPAEWAALER